MSKIVATPYSTFSKNVQWEQNILFHDWSLNPHLFTIKISRNATLREMMFKIENLLRSHKYILKLCFGEDIAENIRRFLPLYPIIITQNNFYTYTEYFDEQCKEVYRKRTVLSNSQRLYEVIKDHRHHSRDLTLRLRAMTRYKT